MLEGIKNTFEKIKKEAGEIKEEAKEGYEKLEKETEELGEKVFASSIFWGLISYLGVLCVLPLLLKKHNRFAQFHAKQGLIMFILTFFIKVPILGQILAIYLGIMWIIVVIQVFRRKYWEIPLIGALAKKIKI